jgi:glycosyltransferase involved in cell wall biosynthesis
LAQKTGRISETMDKQLAVIVPPQNVNWIFDTMAKEICKANGESSWVLYNYDHIPENTTVFVMHYTLLPIIRALNPGIKNIGVYFTHESDSVQRYVGHLNKCSTIIVSTFSVLDRLVKAGVNPHLIHIVPEGDDPLRWPSHRRLERKILISGAYYPRKNPELILSVIKKMPERQFVLLGKDWEKWENFRELEAQKNLEIKQNISYSEYPSIYSTCDVYFSASVLEGGGPHSLIEAMLSNLFPVVTMTGNYAEYIINAYNGFYFKPTEKLENIVTFLNIAFTMDTDVSRTVQGFTWEMFTREVLDTLWQDPTTDTGN